MVDVVDKETRSRMMSGIRGVNTKPELQVRKGLHAEGLRFRLHGSDLPGKPDIVFPRFRTVIFVHGCFWHGHDCRLFKLPNTRREFWENKIDSNRKRDKSVQIQLASLRWRVGIVWECALKNQSPIGIKHLMKTLAGWIRDTNIGDGVEGKL